MDDVTDTDLAYFAGLVDGEGSIGTVKNRTNRRGQMTIAMTTPDVLAWVQERFGGNLTGPYIDKRPNHAPIWTWRILAHAPLERTLTALLPHLKVKHVQAQEVLDFLHQRQATSPTCRVA